MRALVGMAIVGLGAAQVSAQSGNASEWRPALYLFGSSERGTGSAYAPPRERLGKDDAASLALSLDVRRRLSGGQLEASGFALAHDPLSPADRGFYVAARVRGSLSWAGGAWRLRFEDSPRLQRREVGTLSDFQRNDLWLELERHRSGTGFGVRLGDRRRSLPGDRLQGFERQSFTVFVSGSARAGHAWRLEGGPQRFDTELAAGWRLITAAELSATAGRSATALRFTWIEPLGEGGGRRSTAASPMAPLPDPPPTEPATPPVATPPNGADAYLSFSPPPPGLLGPSLIVDPLDADEGDWDFGRRKQELSALVSHRLARTLRLSLDLRAYRERGPDLATPERLHVRRDRVALRATLRRELGSRAALLAQGGWQRVHDNRAGLAFSRGIVCLGLELRP